jgi:hypothetical protein
MKSLLILFALVVGSCFGQQPPYEKGFLGVWNLDLSKSKFPPGAAPKGQQIIVNENGYVIATQDPPPGSPSLVAVAIVRGECYVIGAAPVQCTVDAKNPRQPVITIKQGDTMIAKGEPELVGETTMRVKNTNFLPTGPVATEGVYTKVPPSPPAAPPKK